jgi:hypothetical protein
MKAIITNESKEQDSLDRLSNIDLGIVLDKLGYEIATEISPYGIHDYPCLEMSGDIKILQALVDKSIPMKPTYPKEYPVPTCAVCGSNLGDNKFCRECGREIDWSDK